MAHHKIRIRGVKNPLAPMSRAEMITFVLNLFDGYDQQVLEEARRKLEAMSEDQLTTFVRRQESRRQGNGGSPAIRQGRLHVA